MMRNSKMQPGWIQRMMAQYPITKLPNGNIRTCVVRLAFANVTKAKERRSDDGTVKSTFGAAILFPPGAEQQIKQVLWTEWCELARKSFPNNWNAQGQPFGLHWPVHLCDEKQNISGYTPGCYYLDSSSQYKPACVDGAMNPIVDEARAYSGVWALVTLNPYVYGVSPPRPKKGVGFGMQSVMIVADDDNLGAGGGDPTQDFAGVQIDAAFDPTGQFGAQQPARPPGMAAPNAILPPAAPVYPGQTFVAPPSGFATPAAPSLSDLGLD